jgi:hypothetical protein
LPVSQPRNLHLSYSTLPKPTPIVVSRLVAVRRTSPNRICRFSKSAQKPSRFKLTDALIHDRPLIELPALSSTSRWSLPPPIEVDHASRVVATAAIRGKFKAVTAREHTAQ